MQKYFDMFEEQEFTTREIFFMAITLFFGGFLLGMLFSPKGERNLGCNNGNNNTDCIAPKKKDK